MKTVISGYLFGVVAVAASMMVLDAPASGAQQTETQQDVHACQQVCRETQKTRRTQEECRQLCAEQAKRPKPAKEPL